MTFDACKITVPNGTHDYGIGVSASYWGVQGWEVTNLATDDNALSCFTVQPANYTSPSIHHIILANNVASTCPLAGFGAGSSAGGTGATDYLVFVGNISYRAGVSNTGCGSSINVSTPAASDSVPGTHIYVAGNFSYGTINPPGCYDANGISFDSFDGRGNMPASYNQQAVIENNISVGNEGVGVRVQYNDSGNGPSHSHVYVLHNTMWGNSSSWNQYGSPDCGEYQMFRTVSTYVFLNLAVSTQKGCYNDPDTTLGTYTVKTSDASNFVMLNWGYSPTGTNTLIITSPTFAFGPQNVFGTDPKYASPQIPGAPNCSSSPNTTSCMASMIANFTPTVSAASGYGYQVPGSTTVPNPFFPQWLCNVNLPSGIVTMGCISQ